MATVTTHPQAMGAEPVHDVESGGGSNDEDVNIDDVDGEEDELDADGDGDEDMMGQSQFYHLLLRFIFFLLNLYTDDNLVI